MCLSSFEPRSRYTLLEQVQFHGFSLPLVRKFSEALLRSLAFLARDGVRVIHTDMKPEVSAREQIQQKEHQSIQLAELS